MQTDARKDFATSTVATAPSPATSGTSLVVQSGHGARFPAVPFNATAHPADEVPTLDNAEKVRVTAISTDTFTITRAQGDTSAKSIAIGWRISAAVFAEHLLANGGETAAAARTFGNTDAFSLGFKTNNLTRASIASDGKTTMWGGAQTATKQLLLSSNIDGRGILLDSNAYNSGNISPTGTAAAISFGTGNSSAANISGSSNSTATAPSFNFYGDPNTGFGQTSGASDEFWLATGGTQRIIFNTTKVDINLPIEITPGTSVTPTNNGDVVFEFTNNTTVTVKGKGTDSTVRSGTITLA